MFKWVLNKLFQAKAHFKQIVRVSLKLIANSNHINDETSF